MLYHICDRIVIKLNVNEAIEAEKEPNDNEDDEPLEVYVHTHPLLHMMYIHTLYYT